MRLPILGNMSVEQDAAPALTEKTPLVIPVESTPSHAALHKFDSLSVMEVQSSAKLSSKFEAAKSGYLHGDPADAWNAWSVNALIGFVCGLVSFFLKECIGFLFRTRAALVVGAIEAGGAGWLMTAWFRAVAFAAVLLIISASTILFFEPHAAGSGIPETCAFLNGVIIPKTFSLRVVVAKFTSCALAVGSGIPAGPEGPMIHSTSLCLRTRPRFLFFLTDAPNLFIQWEAFWGLSCRRATCSWGTWSRSRRRSSTSAILATAGTSWLRVSPEG